MTLVSTAARGGGSLPSQWTANATTGKLTITATGASGDGDYEDLFSIVNSDGHEILLVDSAGELLSRGFDSGAGPVYAQQRAAGVTESTWVLVAITNKISSTQPVWFIDGGGYEAARALAAPDTAQITASYEKGYYVATNGAAKHVRVGKTADGTVVQNVAPMAPAITSGALPTATLVSGTAAQIALNRNAATVTPFTGDATNNAATCKVELSPDNLTFSTLNTISIAAALNLTGAIDLSVDVYVPAGWYLKLTATHGALGTTTYYS